MQNLPALAAQPAATLPVNSVQDLEILGKVISQSNLFGKRNPAEGLAIVAMCQQKRISWLDFMQNFHMIQGVVSKKTDAIIADFHRMGGVHKVVARTADRAEAWFQLGQCEYTSTITWADCLAEPFVYVGLEKDVVPMLARGHTPPLKSKYSTPRARMQMLWARCVSDGVRVVAPECVQGIYTPEETADFTEISATPAPSIPTPPTPVAHPAQVQGVASSSPFAVEEVPCGSLKGKRWDELDTPILQQALGGTNPFITTEMKDYIREVLSKREQAVEPAEGDNDIPAEEVSHV